MANHPRFKSLCSILYDIDGICRCKIALTSRNKDHDLPARSACTFEVYGKKHLSIGMPRLRAKAGFMDF